MRLLCIHYSSTNIKNPDHPGDWHYHPLPVDTQDQHPTKSSTNHQSQAASHDSPLKDPTNQRSLPHLWQDKDDPSAGWRSWLRWGSHDLNIGQSKPTPKIKFIVYLTCVLHCLPISTCPTNTRGMYIDFFF